MHQWRAAYANRLRELWPAAADAWKRDVWPHGARHDDAAYDDAARKWLATYHYDPSDWYWLHEYMSAVPYVVAPGLAPVTRRSIEGRTRQARGQLGESDPSPHYLARAGVKFAGLMLGDFFVRVVPGEARTTARERMLETAKGEIERYLDDAERGGLIGAPREPTRTAQPAAAIDWSIERRMKRLSWAQLARAHKKSVPTMRSKIGTLEVCLGVK